VEHDPEIELMLRAATGDRSAFAVLYERRFQQVFRFFRVLRVPHSTAFDLTQETFLRIWKFRKRYAATGSLNAYILSFARFVWLEHCRESRKLIRLRDRKSEGERFPDIEPRDPALPSQHAAARETSEAIANALATLPEDQRMAFILRSIQGLSAEEAASVVGCPVNTIRSRKILAVRKLRELLADTRDALRDVREEVSS
jgi:RNA polymerase sigma-70 factor (ECF subfamily)